MTCARVGLIHSWFLKRPTPGKWILTGSQNLTLLESVSQSLAVRTAVLHLLPLAHNEALRFHKHPRTLDETLFTGGYPRIFDRNLNPSEWLGSYVATYIERKVHADLCSHGASEACVVYGGETVQKRSDLTVLPWSAIHDRAW